MAVAPSASYSLTVRLEIKNRPGVLGRVASAIGQAGGDIGAVDLVQSSRDRVIRDITINARDDVHGQEVVNRLRHLPGARVSGVSDRTFLLHLGGKIEIRNKVAIRTRDDLSKRMARDPIVFAMANPTPEIRPEEAQRHVRVMATGRSDYPNQINNVLCFPGFFRGLLDSRARSVTDEMKLEAARAVADGVARAAHATGVARRARRRPAVAAS